MGENVQVRRTDLAALDRLDTDNSPWRITRGLFQPSIITPVFSFDDRQLNVFDRLHKVKNTADQSPVAEYRCNGSGVASAGTMMSMRAFLTGRDDQCPPLESDRATLAQIIRDHPWTEVARKALSLRRLSDQ